MEIIPVGGYKEIGRNCVIVKVGNESVMLDLGLLMDNYIQYTESDSQVDLSPKKLMEINAVPNINTIQDIKSTLKAICISHSHLDHVGAVPFLGSKFSCPVHAAPYTIEVLKTLAGDEQIHLDNELVAHKLNSRFRVSENIEVEFINTTHSVPHTVIIALHTKEGIVLYANDFKFDNAPLIGAKPNFERLSQLKVKCLIIDSLYSLSYRKTPSESIARELLRDVLFGTHTEGKAVIVTTFSSHLARLKSIVEIGQKMNRKVVLLGRSLSKYVGAGERCGLVDFAKSVEMVKYGSQVKKYLKKIVHPEKYLFVVTGHQGEPGAVLCKMVNGAFTFKRGDEVIFSCNIIPVLENIQNREKLEAELKKQHVRIFSDIHVSGHASREDHRDLINLVQPEHIIPTHGQLPMLEGLKDLAMEMGWRENRIHLLNNNERIRV
ncbi:MAG: MBL fold metallo-hydrolase RNA specificity domain-containing protein [Nanoarchaeota archaeon]